MATDTGLGGAQLLAQVDGGARVAVLKHVADGRTSIYEDLLVERGFLVEVTYADQPLPNHQAFAAVVVMGGPMGANDEADFPWLATEKDFIRGAVDAGIPVWGVCLGAQMLASSLGARVAAGLVPELGVGRVELTEEGKSDRVFGDLPVRFPAFQFHSDGFALPDGAVCVARSELFANQAFSYGSSYGVQFHAEATPDQAAEWVDHPSYRDALLRVLGGEYASQVVTTLADNYSEISSVARLIFTAWLDAYVSTEVLKYRTPIQLEQ